ncbi:DUF72 domain-containing protein [Methylophaga pinxianii]|uniref:DUF72 domain-containing protein n=1 Tax=Methylophaga pinxianii TaxID=2881052 RepID=UPI001CF34192|nr:DUF72 domain-containing protein [Methylophaga pinxianii]MCB2427192.1 DUF72 domain-containing protein [Methylophaga pinxianii]UPH46752.1 DUF72 domain-containing protein [Methylophaga pinxianii]
MMAKVLIGTSGWSYSQWKDNFYPAEIKSQDYLKHYASVFDTTEINNSFYHLPSEKSLKKWMEVTPSDFVFAIKASRYITHNKKLKDPEESIDNFFEAIKPIKKKSGPILFQLPPNWHANPKRLELFLKTLPDGYQYTFEFRDKDWLNDEIYQLLKQHNAALCFYDFKGFQSPEVITADFIYIRLHGPEKAYQGSYNGHRLNAYAEKIRQWQQQGFDVYCYFDNDQKGCAPQDARQLSDALKN